MTPFQDSYFFTITDKIKTSAQFVFIDFCKFSLLDDDVQLDRFNHLRNALEKTVDQNQFHDMNLVFLPTGDGVVIGIISQISEPFALIIAMNLLEKLREVNLDKELRIGVHYGSVFRLIGNNGEQQLIGTGINKAARIEAASKPGKILVSEEYYSHFLDRSGNRFAREVTVDTVAQEFTVKDDKFNARFVSKGKIGK